MKKLLLSMAFIAISLTTFSQELITKEDIKRLKKLLPKELKIKVDYIEREIWVKTPRITTTGKLGLMDTPDRTHEFYFRVTKNKDGTWDRAGLRYKFSYYASSWLWMESMMILCAPTNKETRKGIGVKFELKFRSEDIVTKVEGNATISEKVDMYNNPQIEKWVRHIAETGDFTRIRVSGKNKYIDEAIFRKALTPYATAIVLALDHEIFK